ncbi:vasotab-like [Ischnura elegans]|uniref:vasotab-like n=1 Tax=Ischnura elegans TaxID=197161 RepID=UPI001ED8A53D|nr:vasotab-like [Ischnura elegans]
MEGKAMILSAVLLLLMVWSPRTTADDECPKVCTKEYLPVCAIDANGNTRLFPNECMLRKANCESSPGTANSYRPVCRGQCPN